MYLFIIIFMHLSSCIIYGIMSVPWLYRQERYCRVIISLTVPVFGLLSLIISDVMKGDPKEIDVVNKETNKAEFKFITTVDRQKERNTIPIEEILIVNDYLVKRKVLLDIFKGNPEKFTKELRKALKDPDTETSHYASAALMEINRKIMNSIIRLSRLIEEEPDNKEAVKEYLLLLDRYIKSGILDLGNKQKYQQEYIRYAKRLIERKDRDVPPTLYKSLVLNTYELGEEDSAFQLSEKFIDVFPESEEAYFTRMQICYQSGRADDLKITIETLKESSANLSREGLSTLRFFIGGKNA